MNAVLGTMAEILDTGGWVMYPLLGLSFLSLTLTVERALFWTRTHSPVRGRWLRELMDLARDGRADDVREGADADGSVYGAFIRMLGAPEPPAMTTAQTTPTPPGAAAIGAAHLAAELVRPRVERFGTMMATIIAAAPLLGILGTVLGIITSFRLLGESGPVTDPTAIAAGIAEALYTTAFGLGVALLTLFPHAVFRGQVERCLGRLEALGTLLATPPRTEPAESSPPDASRQPQTPGDS